jgi:hypothetical protein
MRGRTLSCLVAVTLMAAVVSPALGATGRPALGATERLVPGSTCRVFPTDNVWNMDISRAPVNPKSGMWKRAMHAATTYLHPDFGPPNYGIPFNVVSDAHPTVRVRFHYAKQSDKAPYPFGPGTRVEGGSDRHALMVNKNTCTLYELFGADWNGGQPKAGSGAIFHLGSDALRPATWTSADAAGLPIFPGLVRWDEVKSGSIDHAIRFTVSCTSQHFIWPARHEAGSPDPRCPPMGARFRLKSGFDTSHFGPYVRVVLKAMKHYGMILADNGSDWYFQGSLDHHWTYSFVDQLKQIPASAFVAVDESACKTGPNTGRFAYGPKCPAP